MARPNLSYLKNVFLFLFGLPAGVLTGLTAIGSSVVLAPGVRWLLGLRPVRTGATALAATAFAALAGLLSYGLHGNIRWGLALLLTFAQVVGAGWGTRLVIQVPALLRLHLLWAVLTIAVGLALAAQGRHLLAGQPWSTPVSGPSPHGLPFYLWAFLVSALVGLVSRVVELGGVLLVPAEIYSAPPAAPFGAGDGAGGAAAGGAARNADLRPARRIGTPGDRLALRRRRLRRPGRRILGQSDRP